MLIIFFEEQGASLRLHPLTLTRPIADLRIGTLTIAEKWSRVLHAPYTFYSPAYLSQKYPLSIPENTTQLLLLNSSYLPTEDLEDAAKALKEGERLMDPEGRIIACRASASDYQLSDEFFRAQRPINHGGSLQRIDFPEQIFLKNGEEIRADFRRLSAGRSSASLDSSNHILGDDIFVEEGAEAYCATLNTLKGPIYLAKSSELWEGSLIRGPFSLGEESVVKMGAKIYSNVTVGPGCRVGGELNTSVIWGNSAKGHEGYMGNSVIGEWCNWGADTNNSNLKNNYKNVQLYDYSTGKKRDTGLQFCGTIMGDHVKCAINTALNTGTVAGVGAHIFGATLPASHIPSFSWGNGSEAGSFQLEKFIDTAQLVFARRNRTFDDTEKNIIKHVYEQEIGKH